MYIYKIKTKFHGIDKRDLIDKNEKVIEEEFELRTYHVLDIDDITKITICFLSLYFEVKGFEWIEFNLDELKHIYRGRV
jgi:hypothetical protein